MNCALGQGIGQNPDLEEETLVEFYLFIFIFIL
jgi:hypothetical protein